MRMHDSLWLPRRPTRVYDHRRLVLNRLRNPLVNPSLQELYEAPLRVSRQQRNSIRRFEHVEKGGLSFECGFQRVWGLNWRKGEQRNRRFLDEGLEGRVELVRGQDRGYALWGADVVST